MTEDEHPNERLVTPSEDGEGFDRSLVSRRSMLGGSALLAGLLAYTSDPTDPQLPGRASGSAAGIARASDNPDEPLIILGPESDPVGYLFQDAAGGIILQDATSGNHFWYNESQGRWETDAELDVPTLTAERLSTAARDPTVVVHKVGGTTVIDGPEGKITYSGDDAAAIQAALDSLTSGRSHRETVKCVGEFTIDSQINVSSFTVLDNRNAKYTNGGGIANNVAMVKVGESGVITEDAHVLGGVYDGDRNNTANSPRGIHVLGDYPDATSPTEESEDRSGVRGANIRNFNGRGLFNELRRTYIYDTEVTFCGGDSGAYIQGADVVTYRLLSMQNDAIGINIFGGWQDHYYPVAHLNGSSGIEIRWKNVSIRGGLSEFNDDVGVKVQVGNDASKRATDFLIRDLMCVSNGQSGGAAAVWVDSARGGTIDNLRAIDTQGTTTQQESVLLDAEAIGVEMNTIRDRDNPQGITDNGLRNTIDYGPTLRDYDGGWAAGLVLADDWGDDRLTSDRVTGDAGYRPAWSAESGSPSVSSGTLVLPDGSTTNQTVKIDSEIIGTRFKVDFTFQSDPTSGSFGFYIIYKDGSNSYNAQVFNQGTLNLQKERSGSFSNIVSGTWGDDLNTHTVEVVRQSDGEWELYLDGSSQGTATDTFLPKAAEIRLRNTANAKVHIDNLEVYA